VVGEREELRVASCKRLEREAILGVREFGPEVIDLKIDVVGAAAVTTFVMNVL